MESTDPTAQQKKELDLERAAYIKLDKASFV